MNTFVDIKYIGFLSPNLSQFKKKKDGGLFNNPDLERFRNHAEILSGTKKAGTRQKLYNETSMTSAWDEIKRRTKKVK